jgi:hypothetical protein
VTVKLLVGDTRERIKEIPDGSVDLVACSPPFLALRKYGDNAAEMGSERTPADFLDALLELTGEFRRVLAPHGSIAIELGDTYSGSGGAGGDYESKNGIAGMRAGQPKFDGSARMKRRAGYGAASGEGVGRGNLGAAAHVDGPPRARNGWPLAKSLTLIPTLYPASLAYGWNMLNPAHTFDRWRVRNVIVWARPNPPVGCVDDQTEALTPDGWKRHDELTDGELIAAYDPKTDSCRFQPAKFVRWHREGEPMVHIDKRATSQMLTLDHRCLVRTRKGGVRLRLAADLANDCETLTAAPFDDVPGPAPVTVERAALLGWFITEGSAHHRQSRIRQSLTANPEKVDAIRSLLMVDGADFTETIYRHVVDRAESQAHKPPYDDLVTFNIKGELAEWLNLHQKRLPIAYATTWPEAQARALFNAAIDGDGHRRKGTTDGVLFHQKDEAVADAMQVLAVRLGYRATKSYQPFPMDVWQITMGLKRMRWTSMRKWEGTGIARTTYTGVVWCPQVETTFWLARRCGKTFVTGNSLGDKVRPATSYITVACTSAKRWFDLDAVRTEFRGVNAEKQADGWTNTANAKHVHLGEASEGPRSYGNPAGAPPLDWWEDDDPTGHATLVLPTQGFRGAHYAVWPESLASRLTLLLCPLRVCTTCGEPSRRIVSAEYEPHGIKREENKSVRGHGVQNGEHAQAFANGRATKHVETLGWSDCDCREGCDIRCDHWTTDRPGPDPQCEWSRPKWRPGRVLDPFAGSGTTLAVAQGLGRDAVGIELYPANAHLCRERVGMFLEVA